MGRKALSYCLAFFFCLGMSLGYGEEVIAQCSGSYNCGEGITVDGTCVGGENDGRSCNNVYTFCPGGVCVGNYTTCDPVGSNLACSGATEALCAASAACTDCVASYNCTWDSGTLPTPTPDDGGTVDSRGILDGRVWVDANRNLAFDDGDINIAQDPNRVDCGTFYDIPGGIFFSPYRPSSGQRNWDFTYNTTCGDGKPRYVVYMADAAGYQDTGVIYEIYPFYLISPLQWTVVSSRNNQGRCEPWNGTFTRCGIPRADTYGSTTVDWLVRCVIPAPASLSYSFTCPSTNTFSWPAVTGATSYTLAVKWPGDVDYTNYGNITGTSYTIDRTVTPNVDFAIAVGANNSSCGGWSGWRYSTGRVSSCTVSTPLCGPVSCSASGTQATINYTPVSGYDILLRVDANPALGDWYNAAGGDLWLCAQGEVTSYTTVVTPGVLYNYSAVQKTTNGTCVTVDSPVVCNQLFTCNLPLTPTPTPYCSYSLLPVSDSKAVGQTSTFTGYVTPGWGTVTDVDFYITGTPCSIIPPFDTTSPYNATAMCNSGGTCTVASNVDMNGRANACADTSTLSCITPTPTPTPYCSYSLLPVSDTIVVGETSTFTGYVTPGWGTVDNVDFGEIDIACDIDQRGDDYSVPYSTTATCLSGGDCTIYSNVDLDEKLDACTDYSVLHCITPTPNAACNELCGDIYDCFPPLQCGGRCRNPICPEEEDCVCPNAWWQIGGGNVVSSLGSIASDIPLVSANFPYLIRGDIDDPMGIAITPNSIDIDFIPISISGVWAQSAYNTRPPSSFTLFYDRKLPKDVKDEMTVMDPNDPFFIDHEYLEIEPGLYVKVSLRTLIENNVDGDPFCGYARGYNLCYYDASGTNLPLYINNPILNEATIDTQRIILIVKGDPGETSVYLGGRIQPTTRGLSSFFLITNGDIEVVPDLGNTTDPYGVPELEGLFYTDGEFITGTGGTQTDNYLHIRGSVVAKDVVLQRDVGLAKSTDYPSEYFEYGPEQVMAFPPFMKLSATSWEEVQP